jgi:hypothetical protein
MEDAFGDELRIVRTPLKGKLVFNTWRKPFPYLFHRWDIVSRQGWWSGFFLKRSAEKWFTEAEEPEDER